MLALIHVETQFACSNISLSKSLKNLLWIQQFDLKHIKSTLVAAKKKQNKFKSYCSDVKDIQNTLVNINSFMSTTAIRILILCIFVITKSILAGSFKDRYFILCLGIVDLRITTSKGPFSALLEGFSSNYLPTNQEKQEQFFSQILNSNEILLNLWQNREKKKKREKIGENY